MSVPIYADPIHDGAADPTVIRNRGTRAWWMFYTNRRADLGGDGFSWIHGSAIGVATSPDGVSWTYRGTVAGLDDPADPGLNTHWAPEVMFAEAQYHMFLSYISGAPDKFVDEQRHIVHLTSPDLERWTRHGVVPLSSDYVIDAGVARCPDGLYRLWYKDEADGSSTHVASSPDLFAWTDEGVAIPGRPDGFPHEGPNVFELGGAYWMIVDEWHGQGVFRSTDARNWQRQGRILGEPGRDPMDRRFARHADVVVTGPTSAALYYFTHPEWDEVNKRDPLTAAERRTVIHVARVWIEDGVLKADRDAAPVPLP
jgi:hypothetical protein